MKKLSGEMLRLLLNLRLKYKFWLLNSVSFSIICILVLASIFINYQHMLDSKQASSRDVLSAIKMSSSNMNKESFRRFVMSSPSLALTTSNGVVSGSNVTGIIELDAIDRFSKQSDTSLVLEKGMFSFEPVLLLDKVEGPFGGVLLRVQQTSSLLSLFVSQVPAFAITVGILMTILVNRTRFGRNVFAIGGNPEAAELAGINVKWMTLKIFALMGALAGLAGVVASARLNSATNALGLLDELYVIAAAVIGGTSIFGGRGTYSGTVVGALILTVLATMLTIMQIPEGTRRIFFGLIILAVTAVYVRITEES